MILISTLVWRPLCSFEGSGEGRRGLVTGFGGYSEGETPLPIPNREVKPLSADGTWPARAWESRTPPVLLERTARTRSVLICTDTARARTAARRTKTAGASGERESERRFELP